jgi:erythronate-4-phosphate dehydrogenase
MPLAREAFETLGEVEVMDGRALRAADVRDADILAIRSTTRVDRALLEGSRVRFVGTATIGTDHMDTAYLDAAGIRWCGAPGCNANSVAEYVAAALLCLAVRRGFTLSGMTLGIVGVGNVGSRVAEKAAALGLRVLPCDPPRRRAGAAGGALWGDPAQFVPLDRLLAGADAVTLHVPLTSGGPDATRHMAGGAFFARARRGVVFLNTARGAVADSAALLRAMDSGAVARAVVDTCEGEPVIRDDLLRRADIATPHIAGHSFDGKVAGTVAVYREACRFLGTPPAWSAEPLLPAPPVPLLDLDPAGRGDQETLQEAVGRVYDIEADDRRLRQCLSLDGAGRAKHFDALRRDYPQRREFRYTAVRLAGSERPGLAAALSALGFRVGPGAPTSSSAATPGSPAASARG